MTHEVLPAIDAITSDIPKSIPEEDQYGYAPFAHLVAKAIVKTPSPQGLVMAVHGAWGSGKSTLLNFVKHYLALPENADKVVVVEFNPWWFTDRSNLASQFLAHFNSALRQDPSIVLKLGDQISKYADALALASTTSVGAPWASGIVAWLLKRFKIRSKDIPELKENISKLMLESDRRIVFLIDDIDRLTPDELKELFKVLKALADFPNVVYLLSFDREVVQQALSSSLGVNGAGYLEKIVQVPFTLPAVDRLHLRKDLFTRLDALLQSCPGHQFDSDYWQSIYLTGIDVFIDKPRDIVRLTNALFVTYPALAREVNTVDFFALEVLRIFEPSVYQTIRENAQMFVGYGDQNRDENDPARAFHERWLAGVPERRREAVKDMISEMFPKVAAAWGGAGHGSDWSGTWRRTLRACSPELFPIFFQFGLPDGHLSRTELDHLINSAERGDDVGAMLRDASMVTLSDGATKAGELMERLRDLKDEIRAAASINLLKAVFENGSILLRSTEADRGMFASPPSWRLLWCIDHLLVRVPKADRNPLLTELVQNTPDIMVPMYVVERIKNNLAASKTDPDKALCSFTQNESDDLVSLLLSRLDSMDQDDFANVSDMSAAVDLWQRLGDTSKMKDKIGPLFARAELLPKLLDDFKRVRRSQLLGKAAITRTITLDPATLEAVIDPDALRPLIEAALLRGDLTSDQRQAAHSFLRIQAGENVEDFDED